MVKSNITTDFKKLTNKPKRKKNNFPDSFLNAGKNPTYRVVTYQIPVPLGDCSAHLVVSKDGKTVHSAFLMDGGITSQKVEASEQIELALQFIDKEHGTNWKFHAWVVTHWDADHFYGMIDFFENNDWNPCRNDTTPYFYDNRVVCCGGDPTDITVGPKDQKIKLTKILADMGFQYSDKSMGENLIGIDLFTGDYLFDWYTGSPVVDLSTLERPAFCVLAANGYAVQREEPYKTAPTPNQTSILSLILWPNSLRCSYYTGGDGHPAVARDAIIPFLDGRSVTVLKLDHHGSSGELLGTAGDRVAPEDIVTTMRPDRVLVTPGAEYGHPSWDVVAFIYGHYKSLGLDSEDRLHTTRSPYWAQADKLSGKDVNLGKINKIWDILEAWKDKPTPDIVSSWDAWKGSFKMADLKKPDNLKDEDYEPYEDIKEAADHAKHFDVYGEEAEKALFDDFVEHCIKVSAVQDTGADKNNKQLAETDLADLSTKNKLVATVTSKDMLTAAQWRTLFGKWKWTNIASHKEGLGKSIKQRCGETQLSLDGASPKAKGIEYIIARQQERTAWADTMRHLWNHLSPQPVNADTDQCQRFLLRVTSRDSSTEDGRIDVFNADGSKVKPLDTNLRGADTRSYTSAKGWAARDFSAYPMTKIEEKEFEKYAALRKKETELEGSIRQSQRELDVDNLRDLATYIQKANTKPLKATKVKLMKLSKDVASLSEIRKKLYER